MNVGKRNKRNENTHTQKKWKESQQQQHESCSHSRPIRVGEVEGGQKKVEANRQFVNDFHPLHQSRRPWAPGNGAQGRAMSVCVCVRGRKILKGAQKIYHSTHTHTHTQKHILTRVPVHSMRYAKERRSGVGVDWKRNFKYANLADPWAGQWNVSVCVCSAAPGREVFFHFRLLPLTWGRLPLQVVLERGRGSSKVRNDLLSFLAWPWPSAAF